MIEQNSFQTPPTPPSPTPIVPQPTLELRQVLPANQNQMKKNVLILVLGVICLLLLAGLGSVYAQNNQLKMQVATLEMAKPTPSASPILEAVPSPIPDKVFVASPSTSASPSSSLTAKIAPINWVKFDFPQAKLVAYAPKNWNASLEEFPSIPSKLIRFWQGKDASTATIELDIKDNWGSTGDAQYKPRTFQVDSTTMANQFDPPSPAQEKLDRYQTNYYFEKNSHVYVLTCVHNWIPEQYQLCQDMLRKFEFK